MEIKNQEILNQENSQKIPRYPLNGRSHYLIDKFYIIGYNHLTLQKFLFKDENLKKILEENKLNKDYSYDLDLQKFSLKENPKLLNEFSSDYEKDTIDIDTIMEMILPKKLNLYYSESKKVYSKSPEKKNKKGDNIQNDVLDLDDFFFDDNFGVFDESENVNNKKELISKAYKVVFSSNPQSGTKSKKSINGFAYVFYKKLKKEKKYLNKIYSYYIPVIFCIISEFPYYNSFYQLCQKISSLFPSTDIRIPLEVILFNIIKLTPSPLNADIYLSFNSIQNLSTKGESQNLDKKEINNILEDDFENIEIEYGTNNDFGNSVNVIDTKNYMSNNEVVNFEPNKKSLEKLKTSDYNISSGLKRNKRTVIVKYKSKDINIDKDIKINKFKLSDKKISEMNKNIKFDFLTGYPLIQYNLSKVLMQTLSPIDVILIFFNTFLEKDVIFFSKDLEFLSLTLNSYLNLNFPLNDVPYYFNNVTVSFDNFISQNSTFVGSTFTTILGINDSYNPKYQSSNMVKLKDHIAIDLDNGKLYKVEDKSDKESNKKNKELFSFIKNVCKNKETKNEKTILFREIDTLYNILQKIYSKMNDDDKSIYYEVYKSNTYISYDDNIKNLNLIIQDSFYRLINNISMYFYQNLSIKTEGDDLKLKNKEDKNSQEEQEMNVIFSEAYKEDDIYTKEELIFLEQFKDTMKFESFVYNFVQSYNPIDLYKIPLTFTEEFMSFISRKSISLNKQLNFLNLIDELYEARKRKEIIIDLKDILEEYNSKYKTYFNRCIEENEEKKGIDKIQSKIYNESIIKYKAYELDNRILMKYIKILSDLEDKDNNAFFKSLKSINNNIPKMISVTDIETIIENYAIDSGILSIDDLCCVNIIILFSLSLRYMKSLLECQSFLGSLFQDFIVFRKYYSIIMSMVYTLYEESVEKKDYTRAKEYFYLYYLCINSLRNFKLIPNESLMNIIKKFNKINIDSLNKKEEQEQSERKVEENTKNNTTSNIKLYGIDLPEEQITTKNLYLTYNFTSNSFLSENDLVLSINNTKKKEEKITIYTNHYIEPRIKFNNGIHPHESNLFSQRLMLSALVSQYKNYIINMDESKLKSKTNLDACLNILIFMRNREKFIDNGDEIIKTVEKIFYIFLNQIEIKSNKLKI